MLLTQFFNFVYQCISPYLRVLKQVALMTPLRAFCAARDAFGNFQIIDIYVIYFIHRCLKALHYRVNKFLLNKHRDS